MFKSVSFYLAIAGIVFVAFVVHRIRQEPEPAGPLSPPPTAPYARTIGGQGLIESVNENVRIAAPRAGLVREVYAAVGDRVATSAPLLLLDDRQARADVEARRAQIPVLEAAVLAAETTVRDREDQFQRTNPLSERNVLSEEEGLRSRFALELAQAQLTRARAELAAAKAELVRAETELEILTVRAPRDGTVLQVNARAGEFTQPGGDEPLFLLGDIDALQLRADIDEENATQVRPGAAAVAFLKGRRDQSVDLEFVRIEPYIVPKRSLTGVSTERVDTRVLQVIYRFERPAMPLYVGQQMDIFIDAGPE